MRTHHLYVDHAGAQEAEGQTDGSIATGEDIEWILEDCEDPAESEQVHHAIVMIEPCRFNA